MRWWDFPGCPVAMNPPSNVGDAGGISTQGTQIPHATWKLSSFATNREKPVHWRNSLRASSKIRCSQINKNKSSWGSLPSLRPWLLTAPVWLIWEGGLLAPPWSSAWAHIGHLEGNWNTDCKAHPQIWSEAWELAFLTQALKRVLLLQDHSLRSSDLTCKFLWGLNEKIDVNPPALGMVVVPHLDCALEAPRELWEVVPSITGQLNQSL